MKKTAKSRGAVIDACPAIGQPWGSFQPPPAEPRFRRSASRACQRGVSIIEVLVAVAILAIGLLGLARLQATGLRAAHSAYMRSQATNLAYDMSDRMRTNRVAAVAGLYDLGIDDAAPTAGTNLAAQDLIQWREALAATLPNATGGIQRNGRLLTISIRWLDERDGNNLQVFEMRTEI